jgi:hypothetical protein
MAVIAPETDMTLALDQSRLAYARRKVRGFHDDISAWTATAPPTPDGALEDALRDANRVAQDLFALDRLALATKTVGGGGLDSVKLTAALLTDWAATAERVLTIAEGSDDPDVIARATELRGHLTAAKAVAAADPLVRVFRELVRVWRADTVYVSSPPAMNSHWAYQRIIQLGRPVVPLLLRELEREPDFWFTALKTITGADPVPPEARGRVAEMAGAWVRWGRSNNLI